MPQCLINSLSPLLYKAAFEMIFPSLSLSLSLSSCSLFLLKLCRADVKVKPIDLSG